MSNRITDYFCAGGVLESAVPGFVPRPQQFQAAEAVERAMALRGGIALIEAGTGVGKTLAYLVPALQRASPDNKIVISTHTLALQAQLAEKDVPMVKACLSRNLGTTVVKGRGNFLCHMEQDAAKGDLWAISDPLFLQVQNWSRTSKTGDLSELPFNYPGWAEIRANADTCKGQQCRFYDRCFYYAMRRSAQDAGILLVNHALFFSDLALRASGEPDAKLLPDYSFVVFDEAHHMENAVAGAFGVTFSSSRLPALLEKVRRAARHFDIDFDDLQAIHTLNEALFAPYLADPRGEFFLGAVLGAQGLRRARDQVTALGALMDRLDFGLSKQEVQGQSALKDRIDGLRRQCSRAKGDLQMLFTQDHENYARWGAKSVSRVRNTVTVTLNWTPISVGPLLAEHLWKEPRALGAALVSATLSTGGGFGYLRERLGIPKSPVGSESAVTETIVGSPFDYRRRCLFYVPESLPAPSDDPDYLEQLVDQMKLLLQASRGGAFILFTSYRVLNMAYDYLLQSGIPYPLLRQGDMPNARLVDAFKEKDNAVLLGTQSFWEGVDVPGAALRLVIIDKIPFAVPDSPLNKARVDKLTAAGGNWFQDFALPQAQLRLKQGFGRLIRTQSDWGAVAVLDTRLISKSYGLSFLRFLPPATRTSRLEDVQKFFSSIGSMKHLDGF